MTDSQIIESFKPLLLGRITQVFDVVEDEGGTWCTIKFSNGEVHLALIPCVYGWDSQKEEKLISGSIEKISSHLIEADEYRYVYLTAPYIIWLPVESKFF